MMWSLRARWWLLRHVGVRAALLPRKTLPAALMVAGLMCSVAEALGMGGGW